MSERGIELMTKVGLQLSEMTEFFATLSENDLSKPCRVGDADETVGALAAHVAEGYHNLGRILQTASHTPNGDASEHGHGRTSVSGPASLPALVQRLADGKEPIGRLAGLSAEQLASTPPAIPHLSDGRRTLENVIEDAITHQAEHLAALRQAVA